MHAPHGKHQVEEFAQPVLLIASQMPRIAATRDRAVRALPEE
jgi:hypothetical protein